ncbi:glycosyltransferase family A protein [Rhizobium sp. LEGMi198b]
MTSKIAVIYLARLAEGFAAFEAFADSYRKHAAGEPHDLVILCKGFTKPGEFAGISAVFTGLPHQIITIPDDIGLDIHAYREACLRLKHEFVCCLNTFAHIEADDWLEKLWRNFSQPGVGMVGATGSFESLYTSYKTINFVTWAATSPAKFDRRLAEDYRWLLQSVYPPNVAALESPKIRARRLIGDHLNNRSTVEELIPQFENVWAETLSLSNGNSVFRDFPHFPNPHIRSNAFLVRRDDLLAIALEDKGKMSACRFESGKDGLSMHMLKRGLQLIVVGADGIGYPMDQWASSNGFRSGDQSNLLVSDNQTKVYASYSDQVKKTHRIMAFGGFSNEFSDDIALFGLPYAKTMTLAERAANFAQPKQPSKQRFFSIAIPTHNRLDLVLDAIKTVTHQNYDNWEIVVFDNASREPIADAINALGDKRIRSERSDEFLPVTSSWNRAINMVKGQYVTMVGDDDGIAPGYFERINELADRFDDPDLVVSNLYQFMHPGVVPGRRQGYVNGMAVADFLMDKDQPFVLDRETIRQSVDNSLKMNRSFQFNMPAFCCSKKLLEKMRVGGNVLHSPFPDYYFANLAMHLAEKVIAEPRYLAFQGVSKVSFGFTMMNQKIGDGFKVLNHDVEKDVIYNDVSKHLLPGPRYQSEYIVTMAYVEKFIGDPRRRTDYRKYRKHQIWQFLQSQQSLYRWAKRDAGREFLQKLSSDERRWAIRANALRMLSLIKPQLFGRVGRNLEREMSPYKLALPGVTYQSGEHITLFDVFKDIESGEFFKTKRMRSPKLPWFVERTINEHR